MASDSRLWWWLACALGLWLAVAPSPAWAQPVAPGPSADQKETARNLMEIGDKKLAAGDAKGALEAYKGADEIMKVPTTALGVGRASARLGLLVEAVDALQRAGRYPEQKGEGDVYKKAREDAKKLDADLAYRIPTLQVTVTGTAAETPIDLRIDGAAIEPGAQRLPRRLNPGDHVITVSAPGYREETRPVTLKESEQQTITIALELGGPPPIVPVAPPPAQPPPPVTPVEPEDEPISPLVWAGFGVGGAGLLVGAITGGLALSKASDLDEACPDQRCSEAQRDTHDETIALANTANVAFAIGAVGVGVGVVGLVIGGGSDDEEPPVEATVGPGTVILSGKF